MVAGPFLAALIGALESAVIVGGLSALAKIEPIQLSYGHASLGLYQRPWHQPQSESMVCYITQGFQTLGARTASW